jgi:hypothetical protein
MTRVIVTAQLVNNAQSVPPLHLNLVQQSPVKHLTALTSMQLALVAKGGAAPYTYSASGLPAWATLNTATGEITGTPTAIGHFVFTGSVTDSSTNTAGPQQFSFDVVSRLVAIGSPPASERNWAYSYQFAVGGATGAVTWAVTGGTLAGSGLTLTSGGLLSGTPLHSGGTTLSFEVTATDAGSGDTLVIQCAIPNYSEFKTTNTPLKVTIFVGVPYTVSTIGYTGGAAPFSTVSGSYPTGLTVTPGTQDHTAVLLASQTFAQTLVTYTSTDALGISPGAATGVLLTAVDATFTRAPTFTDQSVATATGTNTYAATLPFFGLTTLETNSSFRIKFSNANSGAATLDFGTGAVAIQLNGAALVGGEIPANSTQDLLYDGTHLQLVGASAGSSASGANPTATASDTAVNGSAATFMRSDAAPAVQKASTAQFGVVKPDGTTITVVAGVISAGGGGGSIFVYFP